MHRHDLVKGVKGRLGCLIGLGPLFLLAVLVLPGRDRTGGACRDIAPDEIDARCVGNLPAYGSRYAQYVGRLSPDPARRDRGGWDHPRFRRSPRRGDPEGDHLVPA